MSVNHGARSSYVLAWSEDGRQVFQHGDDWVAMRVELERVAQRLRPGVDLTEYASRYGELRAPGGGIRAGGPLPVSVYNAFHLDAAASADTFVELRIGPELVPILGNAAAVNAVASQSAARVVRYVPAPKPDPDAARRIPNRMRGTPAAHLAAVRLLHENEHPVPALRGLTLGELLWVGEHVRDNERPALTLEIAETALRHEVTPDVLNLKGRALRSLGRYEESAAAFRESIASSPSAEFNPHAHIGLAATLRRLGEYDVAYDHAKMARRHFQDDKYVIKVLGALRRDMSPAPA